MKLSNLIKKAGGIALCALLSGMVPAANAFTVDTVTATYVSSPLNVPSIIEKAQGRFASLYEKMGLKFAYSNLTSGADQTAALASGDIQILNAVGGTSILLAAANGADIKIISMYSRSPKAFMMFSNDPTINSPKDLKGKTIAGPKGTNLHELLAAYLATEGMTISDVNYLSMNIPNALAALEGGSVDVALQAGPSAYNCIKNGKHLITNGDGLIAAIIATATSQKFYDANKEIIDAFAAEQESIVSFMNDHHAEAMQIVAKSLDLDVQAVEDMFAMYDFSPAVTEKDLAELQKTEIFLRDSGMTEAPVDVKTLMLAR